MLERSFHVATLDYDKDEIEARTVEFVTGFLRPSGGMTSCGRGPDGGGPGADPGRRRPRGQLARLALSDEEVDLFTGQLRTVLDRPTWPRWTWPTSRRVAPDRRSRTCCGPTSRGPASTATRCWRPPPGGGPSLPGPRIGGEAP